jgi:hypothetical protein
MADVVRSDALRTWLPAILIGAVLGYAVIYLRETGWVLAVLVTLGLLVVYVLQGRLRDFGLLLAAEGVWPTFVASWGLLQAATRSDTAVGPDSWAFLAFGITLCTGGAAIALAARRARPGAP